MRIFALALLAVALTGCGSERSEDRREPTVGGEVANDYNRQMQKAQNVELQLEQQKAAIDAAVEESSGNRRDP
ncbi:MAG: hypothetical protein OEV41_05080 [Gammaproteobacteria bacterium]|nr:hypothetical protein [Gammaproteobacteria bacterium]MDH5345691.1 hypothetical protein [Gammaproteobacteria bacterium]